MIKFPFFNSQELNLDWIMLKLKEILKFMPLNGNVGDVLQRKADGAAWESISAISMDIHSLSSTTPATGDEIPVYDISAQGNRKITVADIQSGITAPVTSVNTKTGAVVLDKTDIGLGNVANVAQYSASNPPPYPVTSVNGQTGDVVVGGGGGAVDSVNGQTGTVVLDAADVNALPDTYSAPVLSVNSKVGSVVLDKTDIGLGNVANVAQYSASNPPPYPVTSVNGQTGDVVVGGGGGAVDSVNGQTGTVVLDAADVNALPDTYSAPVSSVNTKTGAVVLDKTDIGLGNVANVTQYSASNPPPYPVTSVNGQTGDVVVSGTGLNFDLLWTDPHYPETIHQYSFPAQTVALSLSSYKMVMIETVSIMGFQHFDCFPVPTPNAVNQIYYRITNADQKFFVRDLIITNSGINFQAGGYFDSYNGVQQTDNDYVHPCRIWGIK